MQQDAEIQYYLLISYKSSVLYAPIFLLSDKLWYIAGLTFKHLFLFMLCLKGFNKYVLSSYSCLQSSLLHAALSSLPFPYCLHCSVWMDTHTSTDALQVSTSTISTSCVHSKMRQGVVPSPQVSATHFGFEVLTLVTMKNTTFPDVTLCNMVEVYRCFRTMYCLHLQGRIVIQPSR
jgi:hypothetical protein